MKKSFFILLVIFLIMIPTHAITAQTYFAGNVGVTSISNWKYEEQDSSKMMLNYGIALGHDFSRKLSIFAAVSGNSPVFSREDNKVNIVDFRLFGKYHLFEMGLINVGAQLGAVHNLALGGNEVNKLSVTYLSAGIFANANITQKIKVYVDFVVPFAYAKNEMGVEGNISTIKHLIFDLTIGVKYALSGNMFLSLEGNIDKMLFDYEPDATNNLKFTKLLVLGAQIGYEF